MLIDSPRAGFTLIEVMLSTVMLLTVSGAVYQLLVTTQRLSRTQAEQVAVQSTVRGATLVVVNELKELAAVQGGSSAENDILSIASSGITYRAMRGFGYTCQALSSSQIRLSRNLFTGYRDPQPGRDSALVYVEGPSAEAAWIPVGISNVSTTASCPGTGGSGITLTTSGTASGSVVSAGSPVRIYELVQLTRYQSEGRSWLGMRSVSSGESIQPLFGPLAEPDGFRLDSFDAAGLPTTAPSAVRSIRVALRGVSETAPVGGGTPAVGELTTLVVLRNASP